jgi:hypothetical protein
MNEDKSLLEIVQGLLSGETKPEVTVNTEITLDNATIVKIAVALAVVGIGLIALSQFAWRATLKRFFGSSKTPAVSQPAIIHRKM